MHATFSRNAACVRMSHDHFCCRLFLLQVDSISRGSIYNWSALGDERFSQHIAKHETKHCLLRSSCSSNAVAVAINAGCLATKPAGTRVSWKRRRSLLGPFLCRKTRRWVSSRRYLLISSLQICSVLFSLPLVSHLLHLSTRHSSQPKQVHRIQQNGLGEVDESFT